MGFGLCLIAYFLRSQKGLKYTLNIIGGLLMAIPFALLIYFLLFHYHEYMNKDLPNLS